MNASNDEGKSEAIMKDEYNEFYKIENPKTIAQIYQIREKRNNWFKQWKQEAEWRGFDTFSSRNYGGSLYGMFSQLFAGFFIKDESTVDKSVYKRVGNSLYEVRKGNKKEYKKFKEFYDAVGGYTNLNELGDLLFGMEPRTSPHQNYPIGTIVWDAQGCFLVRAVWFARTRQECRLHPDMIRIKESEYLALQGK